MSWGGDEGNEKLAPSLEFSAARRSQRSLVV